VQGVQGAPANTLLGKPVIECPDLPNIAGGAFPIVMGLQNGQVCLDQVAFELSKGE
jgi:HK97 family phage major capsid protein